MKLSSKRVLVTSGAGPGVPGIVYALRAHPLRKIEVVVGESFWQECAGLLLADQTCKMPMATDSDYLDKVLSICRERRIDIILPVFSGELETIADARSDFEKIGTQVLLPEANAVKLANDKAAFYNFCRSHDILVPSYMLVKSTGGLVEAAHKLGYPEKVICIKPTSSSGNRGFHIINDKYDRYQSYFEAKPDNTLCALQEMVSALNSVKGAFPDLLVMEYISGLEYGADVLSRKGEILAMKLRRKLPPEKLGMHFRIEFARNELMEKIVSHVVASLKVSHITSVDLICNSEGDPYVLEVNPRPGAYIGMTCTERNILAMAIDALIGDSPLNPDVYSSCRIPRMGVRYINDFVIYSDETMLSF